MQEKLIDVLKNYITIPKVLLNKYKNLKITDSELIILIYLLNEKDLTFNPKLIASDLNFELVDVMNAVESLSQKDLLKIELQKQNNLRCEVISLDSLYNKLSFEIMSDNVEKQTTLYDQFEHEFGRTLSPMEYQIIGSWLDSGFSEELIIAGLKEAVYNGVFKLNYIDKILYEWQKKGIKNVSDIAKNKTQYKKNKKEIDQLYDYNWLEEDE